MTFIDEQRQGPGPSEAVREWLDLWYEAGDIFDALPADRQDRIRDAGRGLDVLPDAFAVLDPELRRTVTALLREIVGALTDDCGVSRACERCPRACAHGRRGR